ncbi:MAG: PD-(D/E)XK nuclease family protein, partial [Lachnospiraceae bacterium]|nr:PD-(D/E)XK nuclease family protein [Lachnospiraceae bacterium]
GDYIDLKPENKKNEIKSEEEDILNSKQEENTSEEQEIEEEIEKTAGETLKTDINAKPLKMSSSGLQTLLGCPLAYEYHYRNYIRIEDQNEDDGYQWLAPAPKGNLCHRTLEKYLMMIKDPVNGKIPNDFKQDVFEKVYDDVIAQLKKENPAPTEYAQKYEEEKYKHIMEEYLKKFQTGWDQKWSLIGCEIEFEDIRYTDGDNDKFELSLNGSIDRMDGYVEDDVLKLRIVDYKTGKLEKKLEEIIEGKQIQHFVYANAAIEYVNKHKDELEKMLGAFSGYDFEQIGYDFPYEMIDNDMESDFLDVTGYVLENLVSLDGDTSNESKMVRFNAEDDNFIQNTKNILENTVGLWQNGKINELDRSYKNIIRQMAACRWNEQKAKEKRKPDDEWELPKDTACNEKEAALLTQFCNKNYCKYKSICRMWVGEKK